VAQSVFNQRGHERISSKLSHAASPKRPVTLSGKLHKVMRFEHYSLRTEESY